MKLNEFYSHTSRNVEVQITYTLKGVFYEGDYPFKSSDKDYDETEELLFFKNDKELKRDLAEYEDNPVNMNDKRVKVKKLTVSNRRKDSSGYYKDSTLVDVTVVVDIDVGEIQSLDYGSDEANANDFDDALAHTLEKEKLAYLNNKSYNKELNLKIEEL